MIRTMAALAAAALGASMLLSAGSAGAATIDFELDGFGVPTVHGTEIGEAYANLGVHFYDAYFKPCHGGCPVPDMGTLASSDDYTHGITIEFDTFTNLIYIDNVTDSSWILDAFDSLNVYLGSISASDFPESVGIEVFGIHKAQIRASAPGVLWGIDNLTFFLNDPLPVDEPVNPVPEPSGLAALALGLGALGLRRRRLTLAAILLCAAPSIPAAWAAPVRLIAEHNVATGDPAQDQFMHSYPSLADLLNDTNRVSQAIPLFLSPQFNFAGFTADSGGYRLLAERNIPTGVPEEDQFMHSYPSLTDLLNDTNRVSQAIPLFLSPQFSFAGFTADSGGYRLLAERNIPTGVPEEDQFMHSYPSLTDLLNDTNRVSQAIPLFLSPQFSFAGFTADSGGYRLLAERNIPTGVPEEDQFMHSYPSLTDLLNDTNRVSQAIPLFLSPQFSFAGFTVDSESPPVDIESPAQVPEPSGLAALALGLGALGLARRRS